MVLVMVVLGGLTRLTHSGLSMVEWQPLSVLPPMNEADWEATFAKYRLSPEFRLVNSDMTLSGFKGIFWLEYIHRLWGRTIGLVFAFPLAFFFMRKMVDAALARRLIGILFLGGLQGLMGWVMVKSGLVDAPDVSHYRLAAHLMLAFLILGALLWTALDLLPRPAATGPASHGGATMLLILVGLTATWGAFVAGLDAGLVYNTFPLMNERLFPSEGLDMSPVLLNFVENHGTVQFTHRVLAIATVALASGLWLAERRSGRVGAALTATALWAWVQASLGVGTLLMQVPVALASIHQAGAVILFALAAIHRHTLVGDRR